MGIKTVFTQVTTTKSLDDVTDAVVIAMRRLGGQVIPRNNTIEVIDGSSGVDYAFVAKLHATVCVSQNKKKDNTYDIDCQIRYSPNSVFWICLVAGFCLFAITWVGCILYFCINPVPAYQQALDRVRAELE